MGRREDLQILTAIGLLFGLILVPPARAYLDPGTGSYFIQILAASILGALLSFKLFWGRIKAFFRNLTRPKDG